MDQWTSGCAIVRPVVKLWNARRVSPIGTNRSACLTPVTTDFVYNALFSATTIVNDVYDWMFATPNFGPSDKEGINGLDYV